MIISGGFGWGNNRLGQLLLSFLDAFDMGKNLFHHWRANENAGKWSLRS